MPIQETTTTLLSEWLGLIDKLLLSEKYKDALSVIQLILRKLPRHLATYERLLHVAWQLQLWDEGMAWGARLLSADPGSALAWRAIAMGVEQKGNRAQAQAIWQRAFEAAPYNAEIRTGLSRTTLHDLDPLTLNHACLATLHLRNGRWQHALREYDLLLANAKLSSPQPPTSPSLSPHQASQPSSLHRLRNATTNDFQVSLMVAQWQLGRRQQAYRLARYMAQQERNFVLPWYVLNDLGDVNDKALAHNPLQIMDPGGEYIRSRLGIDVGPKFVEIQASTPEVELLGIMG